jgi:predicted Zn-dependent peptidase
MFGWAILFFLFVWISTVDLLGQRIHFPDIVRKTFPSGFELIAQPDTHLIGVYAAIVVNVGRGNETVAQAGICQLLQELIIQGNDSIGALKPDQEKQLLASLQQQYGSLNKKLTKNEVIQASAAVTKTLSKLQPLQVPEELNYLLTAIGITDFQINVQEDHLLIAAHIPTHQLPKWLALMSQMLRQPLFRDPEGGKVEIERKRRRFEMDPVAHFIQSANAAVLNKHPYGHLPFTQNFTFQHHPDLDALYSFYQTHFVNDKIKVVLTGNFSLNVIQSSIDEFESQLPPGVKDIKPAIPMSIQPINKRLALKLKSNHSNRYLLHFRVKTLNPSDRNHLSFLAYVLTNDSYSGILDSLALTQSVFNLRAEATSAQLGAWLNIYYELPPKSKLKPKQVERLMLAKLNGFLTKDISPTFLSVYYQNYLRHLSIDLANGHERLNYLIEAYSGKTNVDDQDTVRLRDAWSVSMDKFIPFCKNNISLAEYAFVKSSKGTARLSSIPIYDLPTGTVGDITLSDYAKNFLKQPTTKGVIKRYRVKREYQVFPTGLNQKIYYSNNPYGDAYTLVVKLYGGGATKSLLPFMARYLNIVGTYKQSVFEYKEGMFSLGTSYSFSTDGDYLVVRMTGWDSTFSKSVKFIHSLITNPEADIPALDAAIADHNYHQIEAQGEARIAQALQLYITYKKYSPAFKVMNEAKLLQLEPYMFRDTLRRLLTKPITFHYHGRQGIEKVYVAITDGFNLPKRSISPRKENVSRIAQHREPTFYHCPQVARFAFLGCYLPGEVVGKDSLRLMRWMNTYLSHPQIGILTQELQNLSPGVVQSQFEYQPRERLGVRGIFSGSLICEEEQVVPSLTTLNKQIRKLPQHVMRDSIARLFLYHHSFNENPSLVEATLAIEQWEQKGFKHNPSNVWTKWNAQETIDARFDFFQSHIRNKTIAYAYLGESKLNDVPKLSRFGKIVILNKKEYTRY